MLGSTLGLALSSRAEASMIMSSHQELAEALADKQKTDSDFEAEATRAIG
jgi:hypothetical protein